MNNIIEQKAIKEIVEKAIVNAEDIIDEARNDDNSDIAVEEFVCKEAISKSKMKSVLDCMRKDISEYVDDDEFDEDFEEAQDEYINNAYDVCRDSLVELDMRAEQFDESRVSRVMNINELCSVLSRQFALKNSGF